MEDFRYNNFAVQFGEDPGSDINRILNESIVSFSLSHIDFKIGILDKKLQPFSILNNLIRVKKINLYLNVFDVDGNTVGTFKIEDCNFLRIERFTSFLNGFSYETSLKSDYESKNIRVVIDIEKVYYDEIVLYKKESKKISDLESLKIDELDFSIKKKSSGMDYERPVDRIAYIDDPAREMYIEEARPMREAVQENIGEVLQG